MCCTRAWGVLKKLGRSVVQTLGSSCLAGPSCAAASGESLCLHAHESAYCLWARENAGQVALAALLEVQILPNAAQLSHAPTCMAVMHTHITQEEPRRRSGFRPPLADYNRPLPQIKQNWIACLTCQRRKQRTMSSFSLHSLAVRADEHAGHQSQGPIPARQLPLAPARFLDQQGIKQAYATFQGIMTSQLSMDAGLYALLAQIDRPWRPYG